jgi:hypothetical protein
VIGEKTWAPVADFGCAHGGAQVPADLLWRA